MEPRKHSFPPVVDADVRLLVLGSLPGERSLAQRRYYAHPQNQFWQLMSPAAGVDLPSLDYEDRLATLLRAHIGLWDVVATARRRGSTDAAMHDVEAHDIAALASNLPHLRAIAFNGGTALKLGTKQLGPAASRHDIVALPSSSPLHTIGLAAKLPAWAALKTYLE
ncbi:DNA-deoxyinosine glycosylase [Sphingomonas sp. IC-56]|uniref:DNA-deoxyinosine glycosylase n=1 Tax=Sphingomonas sp. IC-56 TaxID=2898529 RepID=UPI001E2A3F4F|nr:DNA-deoxyinosine glycosylase [Sphingomonas sp. IC-56]MCD2322429.1 DNA-deoxyinosine glycosylase [Sphingomonas sp. IC-56]